MDGVGDERRCVFWDFQLAGGYGGWSSEGCELASGPDDESDDPIVECRCNHLTNFAILVVSDRNLCRESFCVSESFIFLVLVVVVVSIFA